MHVTVLDVGQLCPQYSNAVFVRELHKLIMVFIPPTSWSA